MENKLLHIVGGGSNQVPLVLAARKLGLRVLVTDMYENPPCRQYADLYEQIDTTDKDNTLMAAQRHEVDAIITDQTDVAVPTVAYVADIMRLEGIGYETALKFTNKYLLRESLKKISPELIPRFEFFSDPQKAIGYCKSLQREVRNYIIKPINSQGSKGVYVLNELDVVSQVNSAFRESKNMGVLIEEYIDGFEYSVEAYTQDGVCNNLALTKKYHYISNNCIDERNTYLGDVSPELEDLLFSANKQVIQSLGLPFGITHAEYKVHNGKAYLIEIAARGGGGSISSKIVPYLTNFEPSVALIHRVFNQYYPISFSDYKNRFVVMKFFNFKPGKVKSIHYDKELVNDLLVFILDIRPGDEIKEIKDSRDRPGYFVVAGVDRLRVLDIEQEIESSIRIEYE
jgi:biotin carboxylase